MCNGEKKNEAGQFLDSNLLVPHSHLIKNYDNSNTTTADINHSLPQ